MKCFNHPEIDAVMTCSSCGKGLCRDCTVQKSTSIYCSQCVKELQKGLDPIEAIVIGGATCLGSLCYGIGFIIPLILWIVWRENKPEKAKQAGYICIGIGLIYVIFVVLYILFIFFFAFGSNSYYYD